MATDTTLGTLIKFEITKKLLDDPKYGKELQNIFSLFNAGKTTEAQDAYYSSKYFSEMGQTAASRFTLKVNQFSVYTQELNGYKLAQKRRLAGLGVKISAPELDAYLTTAYDTVLTDEQVNHLVMTSSSYGMNFGGTILSTVQTQKEFANSYGVANLFDAKYWNEKSSALFSGATTATDIQNDIRMKAIAAYPAYADNIKNGISMDANASAYRSTYARLMGVDANAIDYNNKALVKALQFVGADGKPAQMPLNEFERYIRTTPEWGLTDNARDTGDHLSLKALTDMGLM